MTKAGQQGIAEHRLEKIAFDYSPVEDRVLARMQSKNNEARGAWLTQRMTRRLVRLLCEHLEKVTPTEASSPVSRMGSSAKQKELMLSFRHQAAVLKHKRGAPIPAVDSACARLLHSIRVRMSDKHIVLTFQLADSPAVLALTQDHAWQLLQVLFNLFRKADWAVDVWPAWMRDSESTKAQAMH